MLNISFNRRVSSALRGGGVGASPVMMGGGFTGATAGILGRGIEKIFSLAIKTLKSEIVYGNVEKSSNAPSVCHFTRRCDKKNTVYI